MKMFLATLVAVMLVAHCKVINNFGYPSTEIEGCVDVSGKVTCAGNVPNAVAKVALHKMFEQTSEVVPSALITTNANADGSFSMHLCVERREPVFLVTSDVCKSGDMKDFGDIYASNFDVSATAN